MKVALIRSEYMLSEYGLQHADLPGILTTSSIMSSWPADAPLDMNSSSTYLPMMFAYSALSRKGRHRGFSDPTAATRSPNASPRSSDAIAMTRSRTERVRGSSDASTTVVQGDATSMDGVMRECFLSFPGLMRVVSVSDFDVLIVGSGPAGLSAARRLSMGDAGRVVVLERMSEDVYSRYHAICGEAISDRMFRAVGMAPAGVIRRVDAIEISFSGGSSVRIPVEGSIVDRRAMLSSMRGMCDAEIVRGTAVSVRRTDGGYEVDTSSGDTFACRFLVGADGAHSTVRRDMFGRGLVEYLPIVNNIVPGDSDGVLRFEVAARYGGGYGWRFPSAPGTLSVGYPKGRGSVENAVSSGARDMPIGRMDRRVDGRCLLVGDAGCMPNQLCFGGIGAAIVSGYKAAEAILSDRPERYDRWASGWIMTDRHFLDAHRSFAGWSDDDIAEAMRPFRKGYSIPRGLAAMLRHPRWANIYMSCWIGFSRGW